MLSETLDVLGELRRVRHRELLLALPHDRAGRLENQLRNSPYRLRGVEYGSDVTFTVAVQEGAVEEFEAWLAEQVGDTLDVLDAGPCDLYLP